MSPDNIQFLIFVGGIVAVILVVSARSVLNAMSDARKAKYLAQVCARHISAARDTQPMAAEELDTP